RSGRHAQNSLRVQSLEQIAGGSTSSKIEKLPGPLGWGGFHSIRTRLDNRSQHTSRDRPHGILTKTYAFANLRRRIARLRAIQIAKPLTAAIPKLAGSGTALRPPPPLPLPL